MGVQIGLVRRDPKAAPSCAKAQGPVAIPAVQIARLDSTSPVCLAHRTSAIGAFLPLRVERECDCAECGFRRALLPVSVSPRASAPPPRI